MANFTAMRAALASSELRERFEAAALLAAVDVANESSTTANHVPRTTWAGKIMANERFWKASAQRILIYGLGTNATFNTQGTAIDDNAVQFIVNSIIGVPSMLADVSRSA